MTALASREDYGVLTEPGTLVMRRSLPGPIERVWAYLTDSDLRRQWLAAGDMDLQAGAPFELVWRNDELTDPPGERPPGFDAESRLQSRIIALDPPRRLVFAWHGEGEVTFDLEPRGPDVLFTVTHRRLPQRPNLVNVAAGWHSHLDLLTARVTGKAPEPHWDHWSRLRSEYDRSLPA